MGRLKVRELEVESGPAAPPRTRRSSRLGRLRTFRATQTAQIRGIRHEVEPRVRSGDMILRALPGARSHLGLLAALGAVLLAMLVSPRAPSPTRSPPSRAAQNADDIDTLYKITPISRGSPSGSRNAPVLARQVPRSPRRPRSGADPRQHTARDRLDDRRRRDPRCSTVVTFLYLPDIENPPASGPDELRAGRRLRLDRPAEPPKSGGPVLRSTSTASSTCGATSTAAATSSTPTTRWSSPPTPRWCSRSPSDVQHSWWIPKLGGKADAVPGHVNETWFKIPAGREGTYFGQCAELCGANHADMRAHVRAVTPDQFEAWAEAQRRDIAAATEDLAAQRKRREASGAE